MYSQGAAVGWMKGMPWRGDGFVMLAMCILTLTGVFEEWNSYVFDYMTCSSWCQSILSFLVAVYELTVLRCMALPCQQMRLKCSKQRLLSLTLHD